MLLAECKYETILLALLSIELPAEHFFSHCILFEQSSNVSNNLHSKKAGTAYLNDVFNFSCDSVERSITSTTIVWSQSIGN